MTIVEEEDMQLLMVTRPSVTRGRVDGPALHIGHSDGLNRRKYLPFALRSIETQTLPRDKFEVVVVKNFEDKESDSIISRNGWKDVYNDDPYYGRMMLAGLEESKGDVITVLDDDDLYTDNRLEKVYKAFTSYERLAYFHNSQTIIDDDGNALKRSPLSKNLVGKSPVLIDVNKLHIFAKKHGMSVIDVILKTLRVEQTSIVAH